MDEFSASLRRLAEAVHQATAAIERLRAALTAADTGEDPLYERAGRPFGPSSTGAALWRSYGQGTTVN